MLITIGVTELFRILAKTNLTLKMPESVPPAVSRAFAAVIPGFIVLFTAGLTAMLFMKFAPLDYNNLISFISGVIQKPLSAAGSNIFVVMGVVFLVNLF